MGADAPMLRSRKHGGRCRVPGHGDWCEVSEERRTRERRDEHREAAHAVAVQIADDDQAMLEHLWSEGSADDA